MHDFYTIAIIALLGAISPGPDFVVVSKNALMYSRRTGCFTACGIAAGIVFHVTYCILGIAIIISQSLLLFSIIKYIGASYLIYLGVKAIFSKSSKNLPSNIHHQVNDISAWVAFRQGLLTNVLNPKCTLFMLAVFTMVVRPHTPYWIQIIYGLELSGIGLLWFLFLSNLLSHRHVKARLNKVQSIVTKVMGAFLVGFGIHLFFVNK